MNLLLCDSCHGRAEEKTCTHGVGGGRCTRCGARSPRLHCRGSLPRVRLLRGRVAVRELQPKMVGRIVLPDTFYDNPKSKLPRGGGAEHRGLVLDHGPPALHRGREVPPEFKRWDLVVFVFGLVGAEDKVRRGVWVDGEPCTWVAQEEVIAVLEEGPAT